MAQQKAPLAGARRQVQQKQSSPVVLNKGQQRDEACEQDVPADKAWGLGEPVRFLGSR
jgi:hypothetical protein